MRFLSLKFLSCFIFVFLCPALFLTASEASITLKITVVNPSSIKQTVPVKVYLPVETKPQDIIYKEDLEVAYDTQLGSYYVFGEYQLDPKGVLEREIEINDVWVVPEVDIETIRQEAKKIKLQSEKSDLAQSIELICNTIDKRLNEISQMQKIPPVSPPQHISNYRYCVSLLESVKNDLVKARSLLAQVPAKPALAATIWKIIIFVIIFLGVLGLTSYIIWQRQEKLTKEISPIEPDDDLGLSGENLNKEGESEEEKPATPEDIEKIIKEGQ